MTQYVALLGSINVGGNRLKMDELKAALEDDGFANVQTIVASGNVLFEHDKAADVALEQRIAQVVKDRFGIASFAAVRSKAELRSAIEDNPFGKDGEAKFVHTIFLDESTRQGGVRATSRRPTTAPSGWRQATASSMSISRKASRARSSIRR